MNFWRRLIGEDNSRGGKGGLTSSVSEGAFLLVGYLALSWRRHASSFGFFQAIYRYFSASVWRHQLAPLLERIAQDEVPQTR